MADTITATERISRDGVLVAIPGTILTAEQAANFGITADGKKDPKRADVSPYDAPAGTWHGVDAAKPEEIIGSATDPADVPPPAEQVAGASDPSETASEAPAETAAEKAPAKAKA